VSDLAKYNTPEPTASDLAYATGKGLMSIIPGAGGLLAEIFGALVTSPVEKRRREWMDSIGEAVNWLSENRGITREELISELQSNEVFVSILIQASNAAVRTHLQEKRATLRNAVVNTAKGTDVDAELQSTFVRYADELTTLHITLLKFIFEIQDDTVELPSYQSLLEQFEAKTGLNVEQTVFRLTCNDLNIRMLARFSDSIKDFQLVFNEASLLLESSGTSETRRIVATPVGTNFLAYISDPGIEATTLTQG
jgi:hypothetical protein